MERRTVRRLAAAVGLVLVGVAGVVYSALVEQTVLYAPLFAAGAVTGVAMALDDTRYVAGGFLAVSLVALGLAVLLAAVRGVTLVAVVFGVLALVAGGRGLQYRQLADRVQMNGA